MVVAAAVMVFAFSSCHGKKAAQKVEEEAVEVVEEVVEAVEEVAAEADSTVEAIADSIKAEVAE